MYTSNSGFHTTQTLGLCYNLYRVSYANIDLYFVSTTDFDGAIFISGHCRHDKTNINTALNNHNRIVF